MTPLFTLRGTVQQGNGRGRKLGFPTINFPLTQPVPQGIYTSRTHIKGKNYNSITFIGPAVTYQQTDVKAESYLFDFLDEVYGVEVAIELLKLIRGNKKFYFNSEEELIKQMAEDKKKAEEFFFNNQRIFGK